jgi:hypothetical protein
MMAASTVDWLGLGYVLRNALTSDMRANRLEVLVVNNTSRAPASTFYYPKEYCSMLPLRHLAEQLRAARPQIPRRDIARRYRSRR